MPNCLQWSISLLINHHQVVNSISSASRQKLLESNYKKIPVPTGCK